MMINKQHFGWGGTRGGLDENREREIRRGRERMWQCWANKTQGLFFLTWDSFASFKMYVWSWGSAEHKLFEKDWCKSGAGDEREAQNHEERAREIERQREGEGGGMRETDIQRKRQEKKRRVEKDRIKIHEKNMQTHNEWKVWMEHEGQENRWRETSMRPPVVQGGCYSRYTQ